MTSTLRTWGKGFSGRKVPQIALGKKIDPGKILKNHCILLGNCTSKLKEWGIFLEGCPPIPSDILKALHSSTERE
jgi:Ni,Fe-hydrogenase III small subunit